jgi:hypothetical protein
VRTWRPSTLKRRRHHRKNALRDPHRVARISHVFPKDGEFISAHSGEHGISRSDLVLRSRNRVFVSKASFDAIASLDNHLIAHRGAHSVVEYFETIQIDEQDGVLASGAALGALE